MTNPSHAAGWFLTACAFAMLAQRGRLDLLVILIPASLLLGFIWQRHNLRKAQADRELGKKVG
jgi:hypothetical protein